MSELNDKIGRLREIIKNRGIFRGNQYKIITPEGNVGSWILDIRNIFMEAESLDLITDIFWNLFAKENPFQIGGQEISAIPLVSAILMKSYAERKPVNGFMIRKSRKLSGLRKVIEGEITDNKIILVDDSIRTGNTFNHEIEKLKEINKKVDYIFAIVSFLNPEDYSFIRENNIKFISLFSLRDFGLEDKNLSKVQIF